MKSRKQRKLEAKQNNEVFVPQYNGTGVLTFEDYYGSGSERFNNKFVTFDKHQEEVVEEILNVPEDAVIAEEKIEIVEAEIVEETPKSKKAKKESKFKKKLKKLFGK